MRVVFLSLFLALAAMAQYEGFSVDERGRAWFVTNLTPRDSDISQVFRLYVLNTSGLRIEADSVTGALGPGNIFLPGASSDGETLSWSERYTCSVLAPCYPTHIGVVVRRTKWFDGRITHAGFVSISRNGLWALWINPGGSNFGSRWANLSTGEEFLFPGLVVYGESVASDGSVAGWVEDAVEVRTPAGTVDRIPTTFIPIRALISADTRHLLVNSSQALFHYNRDLHEWTIVDEECGNCLLSVISTDGARIAYWRDSAPREINLVDMRAQTTRSISIPNDRITGLQLSDDASTIWVKTSALELLRIDATTGEKAVVMAPSPVLMRPPWLAAPGSRFRVDGDGLVAATVSLKGRTLQIMDRGPGWLQLMLPADLPPGPAQWSLESPGALFQAGPTPVEVVPQLPQFLQLRDLGESNPIWVSRNVILGASDGGLINPERPAIPGEELLFWMTGLNGDTSALRWTLRSSTEIGVGQEISMDAIEPDPIRPGWWIARLRLPTDTPPGGKYLSWRTGDLSLQTADASFPVTTGSSPNIESSK